MCTFKLSTSEDDFPQVVQEKGRSPVWVLISLIKSLDCEKDLLQIVQANGRFPIWIVCVLSLQIVKAIFHKLCKKKGVFLYESLYVHLKIWIVKMIYCKLYKQKVDLLYESSCVFLSF